MGILLNFRQIADLRIETVPRHQRLRKRSRILAAVFNGLIAEVMEAGREIEQERDEFV